MKTLAIVLLLACIALIANAQTDYSIYFVGDYEIIPDSGDYFQTTPDGTISKGSMTCVKNSVGLHFSASLLFAKKSVYSSIDFNMTEITSGSASLSDSSTTQTMYRLDNRLYNFNISSSGQKVSYFSARCISGPCYDNSPKSNDSFTNGMSFFLILSIIVSFIAML